MVDGLVEQHQAQDDEKQCPGDKEADEVADHDVSPAFSRSAQIWPR